MHPPTDCTTVDCRSGSLLRASQCEYNHKALEETVQFVLPTS